LTDSKKIKTLLEQYPDYQALPSKHKHKIHEIFRVISLCYFSGKTACTKHLLAELCNYPKKAKCDTKITVGTRRLGLTKDSVKTRKLKIGNRYLFAATAWLKEREYIEVQKKFHETLWIPADKYRLQAFDLTSRNILKEDASDLDTHNLNSNNLSYLVSMLNICIEKHNENAIKKIIEIVRKFPDEKEALLKQVDEHIIIRENEIKNLKILKSLF
jgi:hypothetical protein